MTVTDIDRDIVLTADKIPEPRRPPELLRNYGQQRARPRPLCTWPAHTNGTRLFLLIGALAH
jgi:hypothetical protein